MLRNRHIFVVYIYNTRQSCSICNNLVLLRVLAGFEVSGIIDELCPSLSDCSLAVGDHVVVYPTDDELAETGSVNHE